MARFAEFMSCIRYRPRGNFRDGGPAEVAIFSKTSRHKKGAANKGHNCDRDENCSQSDKVIRVLGPLRHRVAIFDRIGRNRFGVNWISKSRAFYFGLLYDSGVNLTVRDVT